MARKGRKSGLGATDVAAQPEQQTGVSLPIGAYMHPAGLTLEIARCKENPLLVIVRVGGRLDFLFLGGQPYLCGTIQGPPQPLFQPQEPEMAAPKLTIARG